MVIKMLRKQKKYKVLAVMNGYSCIFEYITYRKEGKKILAGIVIRAFRKLQKKIKIKKGAEFDIHIQILEVR